MNSKKNAILAALVGVLVLLGIIVALASNKDDKTDNSAQNNQAQVTPPPKRQPIEAPKIEESNKITMKGNAFVPAKLTVKKGTQVQWSNLDDAQHDVTPDEPRKLDQFGDDQRAFRGSGTLLGKGQGFSVAVQKVGTYTYHCSKHPEMKGVIEVVE